MVTFNSKTLAILSLLQFAAPLAHGGGRQIESRSFETKTFGKTTGATVTAGNPDATQTIEATTDLKVIGKSLNAFSTLVESPNDIDIGGVTYTTVYSFGKRVFADAWTVSSNGTNNIRLGLAPTEVRLTFVKYPVGPVTLNVAGGTRFQAVLDTTLVPEVAFPIEDSSLGVNLMAMAQAAAFVEAYASILIIRGGVGGQVDVVDGNINVNGRVNFKPGMAPAIATGGIVHFFKGRFYAFLDLYGFIKLGWKRLIDKDIYTWQGFCFSVGYLQCPAK